MNWIKYGGIQERGQLLNGWMERGVLGESQYGEIEFSGGRPVILFNAKKEISSGAKIRFATRES